MSPCRVTANGVRKRLAEYVPSWEFYLNAATFTNGSGMLIFAEMSFER